MEITIKLTGLEGLAESIGELAAALRAGAKAEEVIKTASRKAKKTEQTEAANPAPEPEAPAATQPAVEETKPAAPEPATASPSEAKPDPKAALLALVKAKGHPAGAAVLTQFGATKLSDLKETDFPAFVEAAQQALA